MAALEPPQDRRQGIHEHRRARADADSAEPSAVEPAHLHLRAVIVLQKLPRVGEQLLAGLRQVGALAEALHQIHVETALELLHLMRYRRLRQIELFCRRGETAALDDLDEGPELIEIEASHGPIEP